ncbi:hypothetical protein [Tautonia marina]|uniref:hypothetical protein n=1 Tax=Tautonia marina TaxID=2653855 RepID=UPI001260C2B5|nr:hypothetical protein [Tautonia marina]
MKRTFNVESPGLAFVLLGVGLVMTSVLPVGPWLRVGIPLGRVLIVLATVVAARSWHRLGSKMVIVLGVLELGFNLLSMVIGAVMYVVVVLMVGGWNVK